MLNFILLESETTRARSILNDASKSRKIGCIRSSKDRTAEQDYWLTDDHDQENRSPETQITIHEICAEILQHYYKRHKVHTRKVLHTSVKIRRFSFHHIASSRRKYPKAALINLYITASLSLTNLLVTTFRGS